MVTGRAQKNEYWGEKGGVQIFMRNMNIFKNVRFKILGSSSKPKIYNSDAGVRITLLEHLIETL